MRPIDNGAWEVYQEGARLGVVENGQCVVDSKRSSCMWFGIAFDYTAPASDITLKCTWRSNEPIVSVTPSRVLGRLTEQNVDLVLPGRSGHEVTPGYVELPWQSSDTHLKYDCSHQGVVVLSVEFELTGSA